MDHSFVFFVAMGIVKVKCDGVCSLGVVSESKHHKDCGDRR
jgi:hypothetical protein